MAVVGVMRVDGGAAGMTARPSTGMPASPMLEQLSAFSISTELGQSDWRISPYERNPPSEIEEGGGLLLARLVFESKTSPLLIPPQLSDLSDSRGRTAIAWTQCETCWGCCTTQPLGGSRCLKRPRSLR